MAVIENGFEVIYDSQITTTTTGGPWQPGQIVLHRSGTGRAQSALAKWVKVPSACSQGEALVADLSATSESTVAKAATTDSGAPIKGIAAASCASGSFIFAVIQGYCENADSSQTCASGEYLMVSASTAGKLSNDIASTFNTIQGTVAGSLKMVVAVARGAFATGVGSVNIVGMWG
jgi:hypothetical protein